MTTLLWVTETQSPARWDFPAQTAQNEESAPPLWAVGHFICCYGVLLEAVLHWASICSVGATARPFLPGGAQGRGGEGAPSKVAGQQMEGSGARVGIRAPRCVCWLPGAAGQPAELWGSSLNRSQNEGQRHPSQTSCCLELWEPQRWLWISLNAPLTHTNDPLSQRPAWLKQGKWTHRDLVGVLLSDQSHIFYSLFCRGEGSRNTWQFYFGAPVH